jgi:hypothetical protein
MIGGRSGNIIGKTFVLKGYEVKEAKRLPQYSILSLSLIATLLEIAYSCYAASATKAMEPPGRHEIASHRGMKNETLSLIGANRRFAPTAHNEYFAARRL